MCKVSCPPGAQGWSGSKQQCARIRNPTRQEHPALCALNPGGWDRTQPPRTQAVQIRTVQGRGRGYSKQPAITVKTQDPEGRFLHPERPSESATHLQAALPASLPRGCTADPRGAPGSWGRRPRPQQARGRARPRRAGAASPAASEVCPGPGRCRHF